MSRDRSSTEIRQSIEETRSRMDATIDQLEQRLSPREIVDHAWSYVREHGNGVGDALRDHPVPLSLMGLGVAWLAVEEARGNGGGNGRHGTGTYERAEGRVGPYRGDALSDEAFDDGRSVADRARDAASGVKDAASTAKDKVAHAADSVRDKASEAGHRVGDAARSARSAGHRASDGASHAADELRRRTSDLAGGIQSFYRDSPLAVGAITFGLGLAAALSGPSTDAEDRLMGEASDRLKSRAKHTADELGHQAAHVAGDTAAAAAAEANRQGEGLAGEMKERAKHVADEARDAAKRSARETKERDGFRET